MQNPSELSSQRNLCRHNKSPAHSMQGFVNGGGEWIRTTEVVDNRFTVCPLWPLGNSPINYTILYKACPAYSAGRTAQFGAGERTRTPDLLITNQLLYQLSYTSKLSLTLPYYISFPLHCQEFFQFFCFRLHGLCYSEKTAARRPACYRCIKYI